MTHSAALPFTLSRGQDVVGATGITSTAEIVACRAFSTGFLGS